MQFYWTTAAPSTISTDDKFDPPRFRYDFGNGGYARKDNGATILKYQPPNADCVEYKWPQSDAESNTRAAPCRNACPVLCKSVGE